MSKVQMLDDWAIRQELVKMGEYWGRDYDELFITSREIACSSPFSLPKLQYLRAFGKVEPD